MARFRQTQTQFAISDCPTMQLAWNRKLRSEDICLKFTTFTIIKVTLSPDFQECCLNKVNVCFCLGPWLVSTNFAYESHIIYFGHRNLKRISKFYSNNRISINSWVPRDLVGHLYTRCYIDCMVTNYYLRQANVTWKVAPVGSGTAVFWTRLLP
jgi:hypothetical protein